MCYPAFLIPHTISDPVSDLGAKNCLWQESLYDEQVPNRITESMMRTMDVPQLTHSAEMTYGLDTVSADHNGSGFIIWHDTHYDFNALGNLPYEGGAHKAIRVMSAWRDETQYYLEQDGVARNFCDGECSF